MAKLGEYWVIVELDTELFLGLPHGTRGGRGFTHTEPSTIGPPRLFMSKHDAQVALTWWLDGPFEVSDWEEGSIKPILNKPYRDRSNYEVVEVSINYAQSIRKLKESEDRLHRKVYPDTSGQ